MNTNKKHLKLIRYHILWGYRFNPDAVKRYSYKSIANHFSNTSLPYRW